MANTLGLSIIVKNEAHCIERMLNTIYPILDYYTVVDTGSTDNTKEIIQNFFESKGIPGQILDRQFDTFENSRNFAMDCAKDKTTYSIWIDADEELIISDMFDKSKLTKDLYMISTHIGAMTYTRNELWRNDKAFRWYGPVHEFIVCDEKMESEVLVGLDVKVNTDGGSWQGNIATKYLSHAHILEKYIADNNDPRWTFYTAQSWHDSAVTQVKIENNERLRRSLKYYKDRRDNNNGYNEEIYYSQLRIAIIKMHLGEYPMSEVLSEFLKAYDMEPLRGEPFKFIIEMYQRISDWNIAYLYSKIAYDLFHNKSPYPHRLLFIDAITYDWKLLELYMISAFQTKRHSEAKMLADKLVKILNDRPQSFNESDINRINGNIGTIVSTI